VRRAPLVFLGATGLPAAAMPWLPAGLRPVLFTLISAATVVPLAALVRNVRGRDGRPWQILLCAMTVLTVCNGVNTFGGPDARADAEILLALGHAVMLAAAVSLVLRRGRNDIGGLLDVSVAAIALGGLLWTALLLPRLHEFHTPSRQQAALLVSILVLAGVLGALGRLWFVSDRRLPALTLLCLALVLALIGNVVITMVTGSMTVGRAPAWIQVFFLLAYVCVGLVPMHPSVRELTVPGPLPDDRLSTGRLVFLGAALTVNPVAGGVREMMSLPADGALLAFGCLLVVPLVLVRVGRLSRERQAAEAALHHQASHDVLTGLPNRAELLRRLDAALDRERRTGRPSVVLLFCDLNGFKQVNDRLGHRAGDELLIQVGARLRAGLRAGDTLARYGGDEFLILCEDAEQEQAAERLCAHVETSLAGPFRPVGEQVRIGASVGSVLSDSRLSADDLIGRADQAMYRAKQRTRVRA
jgi:diguanylate cyclase (GGDEF)-like protein